MATDEKARREALEEILERIDVWHTDGSMEHWQYSQLFDIADAALAAPARNCDLPNPEGRYSEFCSRYQSCSSCPHNRTLNELRCDGKWLLALADEGGAK